MAKYLQDKKTGKLAGSIGNGKTATPTAANRAIPKIVNSPRWKPEQTIEYGLVFAHTPTEAQSWYHSQAEAARVSLLNPAGARPGLAIRTTVKTTPRLIPENYKPATITKQQREEFGLIFPREPEMIQTWYTSLQTAKDVSKLTPKGPQRPKLVQRYVLETITEIIQEPQHK